MNNIRFLAAAGLLAAILSLWPLTGRRFIPMAWTLVALCAAVVGAKIRDAWRVPEGIPERHAWLPKLVAGYVVYYVIRAAAELWFDVNLESGTMGAQSISGMNAALVFVLAILFIAPHSSAMNSLSIFYLAVGMYSGVNLVADKFIFIGREFVFGESRFDIAEFRWLPPLVRSNAFFSMTCVVAMGGIMGYASTKWRRLTTAPAVSTLLFVAFGLCAYGAFKTQFRANILILATAVVWIAIRSIRLRKWLSYTIFTVMLLFPTSFALGIGHDIIALIAPERLLEALGSKTGESDTLSERTQLYEYGGQRLLDKEVLIVGEGPVYRDAQDALGVYKTGGYRMPYHAASFDFLIDHGVFIGGAILFSIFALLQVGFGILERVRGVLTSHDDVLSAALLNLVLWLSTSVMDSGMSNLETFCFATFPVIGAIAFHGRCEKLLINRNQLSNRPRDLVGQHPNAIVDGAS